MTKQSGHSGKRSKVSSVEVHLILNPLFFKQVAVILKLALAKQIIFASVHVNAEKKYFNLMG